MRIRFLLLLLTGLLAVPALCGPSLALAADAEQVSVTHALDTHALDACDEQSRPPVTTGSLPALAPPAPVDADLRLAPDAAVRLFGNAFTPHGAVQLHTPLRL